MRFICFTGIDGSGKSTLARWLVSYMKSQGVDSRYVYSRYRLLLSKPFMSVARSLFLHGEHPFKDYNRYVSVRQSAFENGFFSSAYKYVMLLDYIIQALVKVRILLMLRKNIVVDRYVYDTVITDFALDAAYSDKQIKKLIDRLFLILPKPDIVFLVDVSAEIAYRRKTDVPSISYPSRRRPLYLNLAKRPEVKTIDGSKSIEELRCTVIDVLLQH